MAKRHKDGKKTGAKRDLLTEEFGSSLGMNFSKHYEPKAEKDSKEGKEHSREK